MSAYAAAYAPPPPGSYGGAYSGFGGGYGSSSKAASSTSAGAVPGAPKSFAPPGGSVPPRPAGAAGMAGSTFTYPGLGGGAGLGGMWPSAEQLVAAVPARPYEFSSQPQKAAVGDRGSLEERRGLVAKPFALAGDEAEFFLLKGVLSDNEVAELVTAGSKALSALITAGKARELDPTDGRPRFAVDLAEQGNYSSSLEHVLRPLVEGALLPYIRTKFGCPGTALSSVLFRRYLPEERRFIPPHHEHGAFAVCVLGLQDPAAYTGGMFVQGSGRAFLDRKFLPLGRGDVCVHRYDLHHGVDVQEGSRVELLLIFKDSAQAAKAGTSPWYLKAAEAGEASAQYAWALSLLNQKDYTGAKSWLDKACAQDYPEALYLQADWAWEPPPGTGFPADTAKALQLLRRAAELGHGRSQSRLGGMLAAGIKGRVQQDSWEGKRLLRLAFEQDEPDAGFHLGQALLQEGDRDGATKLLAACAKGHPRACFQVAELYREGQYQFSKDVPASLRYTKWAAHQGDAQAMSNLGHLLVNGMGVVRDEAKAVRLFRHAAKLGAAEGMLNYGLALLRGSGGAKVDYQEALEWAQKSAAQGHTLAHQQLPMFFNAAKNPNPPARSLPRSEGELRRLGVKDLRDLLRAEGIDFSDCVEKSDLIARAAMHLLGEEDPWDPAPEHTLLLEPPKKTRAELLKQRQQAQTVSPDSAGGAATGAAQQPPQQRQQQPQQQQPEGKQQPAAPSTTPAAAAARPTPVQTQAPGVGAAAPQPAPPARGAAPQPTPAARKPKDDEFEFVD